LKNVSEPVRIYEAKVDRIEAASVRRKASKPVETNQRKGLLAVAGVLMLVLLGFPYNSYFRSASEVGEQTIEKSIAVLPFADMSQAGDQQYFADGVMEDILTQLQRIDELKVTSRTSVEQYRNTTKPATEIGPELNVSYLLEGSVRKAGDQMMITAQLIDASADQHLWADNYPSDYTTKDLFEIQRKIAENIVGELKLKISPIKVAEMTQAQTENTAAYEHFQRGREYYYRLNNTSMDLAIEQFKKAIELDPDYALAYGMLSSAYALKSINYGFPLDYLDSTALYAKRGLEIDKNCDWCYKGLSQVESAKYSNYLQSIEYKEKALGINPNNGNVAINLMNLYYRFGMIEKAIELLPRMLQNGNILSKGNIMALLYYNLGDYDKAKSYLDVYIYSVPGGINQINSSVITGTYTEFNFLLNNVDGFIKGSESTFKNTEDSVHLYNKFITSYWMQKDYQGVVDYYEKNQDNISYHQHKIWAFQFYLVPHSYLALGDIEKAKLFGRELLGMEDGTMKESARRMSLGHLFTSEIDSGLHWLEKAIDLNYLDDISTDILYKPLYNYARFQDLVIKQNKKREEALALIATYDFPEPEDL